MASPLGTEDDILERLKRSAEPQVVDEQRKAIEGRVRAQYERAQQRLAELINENSTLPVTISDVRIHGLKNTRDGFLQRVFDPVLDKEKQANYTLKTAMDELQRATSKLHQFGIFHSIDLYLDQAPASTPDRPAISALLSVKERSRFTLKSGTEFGNVEGGGYLNATLRNVFGGAESLYASASAATSSANVGERARSTYEAMFSTPIAANPSTVVDIGIFSTTRSNQYFASHAEANQGVRAGLRFITGLGEHELTYNGVWRQVTDLGKNASFTVRGDAGDTTKSSITHTVTADRRDNSMLPTAGYLLRNHTEIAGAGPLGGDVAFLKNEFDIQKAASLPFGISFTTGIRGGVYCPLPLNGKPGVPSRINDRFFLGGATDVRGFRENGLGPKDGEDFVGGDAYIAYGASMFFPLPKLGVESPLRLQAFVNGGRLLATEKGKTVEDTVKELVDEVPSVAAGVGLMYAAQMARFELNVAMPLIKRPEERARKGLQLGVGISFL
ncbi:hypothetical protein EX30DRAFT_358546 [Ascodesmis nigricans]|uniref:Bacterial surface antigen (D15) domain-containing protein n=1 Tax=Ascodesmis nigricans TaxID=341454 RepID=A0A4S2N012_9PEZI|nr:hypothetical protein EX30DRAFT_358546 [Ascodesmis nigricans]